MTELLTALGLMCVIEGLMYAGFPRGMREMLLQIARLNDIQVRQIGLGIALVGLLVLAFTRGF